MVIVLALFKLFTLAPVFDPSVFFLVLADLATGLVLVSCGVFSCCLFEAVRNLPAFVPSNLAPQPEQTISSASFTSPQLSHVFFPNSADSGRTSTF
jgi:hypothetical protein